MLSYENHGDNLFGVTASNLFIYLDARLNFAKSANTFLFSFFYLSPMFISIQL